MNHIKKLFLYGIFFISLIIFAQTEDSKPLLRVFPIFREEECDWSIRLDICLYCIRKGEKYAQKIYFYSDRPYRVHGCYTEKKGFYTHEFPRNQ
jgi:hypothetical protein